MSASSSRNATPPAAGKGKSAPARKNAQRTRAKKRNAAKPEPAGRTGAAPKATQMQKSVAGELEHLRTIFREVSSRYADRLESKIAQIHETVLSCRRSPNRRAALAKMHQLLGDLSLKPEKGRRKDLKKIDRLVAELNKIALKL